LIKFCTQKNIFLSYKKNISSFQWVKKTAVNKIIFNVDYFGAFNILLTFKSKGFLTT